MITQFITKKPSSFKYNLEKQSLERCFTVKVLEDLFVELDNLLKEIERIKTEDYSYHNYLSKFRTEAGLESLQIKIQDIKSQILRIKQTYPDLIDQHQELFDRYFEQKKPDRIVTKKQVVIAILISIFLSNVYQTYNQRIKTENQITPKNAEQLK